MTQAREHPISPEAPLPLDDILEALDLSRSEPGIGLLDALFARFNERVPFETATEILRNAEVADPLEKPRRPDLFWAEHLELGTGGTCHARVAAFGDLLAHLKFKVRPLLGRVRSEFDHAALLVELPGQERICDVGFPLPALLPPTGGEVETALGNLRVDATERGYRVAFSGGVPEGPRALEIFAAPVSPEEFAVRWRQTFRPDSKFSSEVYLSRQLGSRTVSVARGEARVDDLHSRTRIPLLGERPAVLEEEFGINRTVLARAFAIAGDPEPEIGAAQVEVYLEVEAAPADAFAAIASPAGYAALMGGVARVALEAEQGSWRARLWPAGETGEEAGIQEEITPDPASLALRVRRGNQDSFYLAQSREGRTFLIRRAILSGAREDLLRNDSLRGRLAGTLAVDLLAWARIVWRS